MPPSCPNCLSFMHWDSYLQSCGACGYRGYLRARDRSGELAWLDDSGWSDKRVSDFLSYEEWCEKFGAKPEPVKPEPISIREEINKLKQEITELKETVAKLANLVRTIIVKEAINGS